MALRSTVRKVSELAIVTPMLAADAEPIVRPTMAAARTNLFILLLLLWSVRRHPVFVAGDAHEGRTIGTCRRPIGDSSRQGCLATRLLPCRGVRFLGSADWRIPAPGY